MLSLEVVSRNIHSSLESPLFQICRVLRFAGLPENLIWLAHALEALFDTPPEGIGKHLRNRIFKVLGRPQESTRQFKKQIDDFYQLRSRFIHGDLAISHPIETWSWDDEDIDKYTSQK